MTRNEVEKKVFTIVRDQFGLPDEQFLTPATRFREDLDADCLDSIELIMEAEDVFEILIPDDVGSENWKTIGEALDYLYRVLGCEAVSAQTPLFKGLAES